MTQARIINAIVWIAIAVALIAMVTVQWHQQGCELRSLVLAGVFYTTACTALGKVIDLTLQGK